MQDEHKQVRSSSQIGPGVQSQTQIIADVMLQVGPCPFKLLAKGAHHACWRLGLASTGDGTCAAEPAWLVLQKGQLGRAATDQSTGYEIEDEAEVSAPALPASASP